MSAWRRQALAALPECEQLISEADSPMALWIELHFEFKKAFEADDLSRIRRFIDYAKWCWSARDGDTVNAVACAFLEHLPEHQGMRARIPEWFDQSEFDRLRPVFTFRTGEAVLAEIQKRYRDPRFSRPQGTGNGKR